MKKRFTLITAAVMLLTMMASTGTVWGQTKEDVTATLTGEAMIIGNNPSTSYTDYTSTGATDDKGYVWHGRWCYQKTGSTYYEMVQIRTYTNNTDNGNCSRLNVPTFSGTIKTITLSITNTSATTAGGTGTAATLYLATSYSKTEVVAILTDESASNRTSVEFDLTELNDEYSGEGLYILANGGVRIWSVVVVYTPSSGSDLTDEEFSWSAASFTANIGQSNSYPTLTNTHNLDVTYQSTDESVATINSSGVITLEDEGTTTIKAVFAGNSTYNAKTTTYALTVVDPTLTTIWSEVFSGYSENDVPSGSIPNPHTGTTVHGGVTITYACTNGDGTTKIYENASTGGESPELLVGKSNGTFSATIPLTTASYGFSGDLVLRFKMNANALNVNTTTDGVTVDGEENEDEGVSFSTSGLHKVIFEGVTNATESITVVFTATSSSNVRIDDIVLRGAQAEFTKVATPVILPFSGAVISGTEVTITCSTPDATIYYTMGETPADPTSSSTQYDPANKPTITVGTSIKAIAIKAGLDDSEIASASYTLAEPCATPTFSPAAGEVEKGTTITISTETDGATIYYTTNGTTPTTSSTTYSSAITINSAMTIKAIAAKDGMANSEVASASYTIKDYATLPFVWTGGNTTSGGGKDDLTAMTGVTASGLGSDYAQSNAPYRIKFDNKDDYIRIKLDGQPARITIAVKMLGGGTTSKIKVQESATGESFTDIEELTIAGASNAVLNFDIANTFSATTRYVKIIKSVHGSNVGVGPIVIYKTTEIAPNPTWTPSDFTPVANNVYVISGGNTLTLNGDFSSIFNDPKILVIKDGAQLISGPVQGTMQKEITAYTPGGVVNDNWKLIASPLASASVDIATIDNYDLYVYDESTHHWLNERVPANSITNFTPGRGYLYANEANQTLEFAGQLNYSTFAGYPLSFAGEGIFKGLNLVSNPRAYQNDMWISASGVAVGNVNYLMMKADGTGFTAGTTDATGKISVLPLRGLFVQATATGQTWVDGSTVLSKGTDKSENTENSGILTLNIHGNGSLIDNAIVRLGKGHNLGKVVLNENSTKLYISQGSNEYAIVRSAAQGELPVNFKAAENGSYTLSIETKNVDLNYLHLIDKLTGNDIDLLMTPSYTFEAKKGDNENRFRLVFNGASTGSETAEPFAYFNGSEWVIENDGNATLQVIDVMGRMLRSENVSGNATTSLPNLSAGVYVLRLVNSESIRTQKVVIE